MFVHPTVALSRYLRSRTHRLLCWGQDPFSFKPCIGSLLILVQGRHPLACCYFYLFIYFHFLIKKNFFLILIFTALHWWCSNMFLHMYLFLFQTWASHVPSKHIFFTKAVFALHGAACVASTFIGKADQQPVAPPLLLPPSHPPQTLWTNPYPFYFFSVSRNSHCVPFPCIAVFAIF